MKHTLIFFVVIIAWLSYTSCKKKHNATPTPAAQTPNLVKVDSVYPTGAVAIIKTPPLPYDVYIGHYDEHNYYYSGDTGYAGTSTVNVIHSVNGDSIFFVSDSIGTVFLHPGYTANINVGFKVVPTNSYTFSLKWTSDREDYYTCTLHGDTLQCMITITTGYYPDGQYYGRYTGIKQ